MKKLIETTKALSASVSFATVCLFVFLFLALYLVPVVLTAIVQVKVFMGMCHPDWCM